MATNYYIELPKTNFNALGDIYVRTTRFQIISSGTSGTVTLPSLSTVVLDDFGGTTDAIITGVSGGKPTFAQALDSGNNVVATSFDALGNYTLTSAPASYPVAIIYRVKQKLINFDDLSSNIVGDLFLLTPGNQVDDAIVDGVTGRAPSQNAVYDALALKVSKSGDTMTGTLTLESLVAANQNLIIRNTGGWVGTTVVGGSPSPGSHNIIVGVSDIGNSSSITADVSAQGSIIAGSVANGGLMQVAGEGSIVNGYVGQPGAQLFANGVAAFASGFIAGGGAGNQIYAQSSGAFVHGSMENSSNNQIKSTDFGATCFGHVATATQSSVISSESQGSLTIGFVESSSIDCQIQTTEKGSFVKGFVQTGSDTCYVRSTGLGAAGFGQVSGTSSEISFAGNSSFGNAFAGDGGKFYVTGDTAVGFGIVINSGSVIQATSEGSFVNGKAQLGGILDSSGAASVVMGVANGSNAKIVSNSLGSFATGRSDGVNSLIEATNSAAFARGVAIDGSVVSATGEGSFAIGFTQDSGSALRADGLGSFTYGTATGAAQLLNSSNGTLMFGLTYGSGSYISASGGVGQFIGGNARGGGKITGTNDGAFTWGATDNLGLINNFAQGSTVFGFGFASGTLEMNGSAYGSFLYGYTEGATVTLTGAKSFGVMTGLSSGTATGAGDASITFALVENSSSILNNGQWAFARIIANNGNTVEVSGSGSSAFLDDEAGGMTLSGEKCFVVGSHLDVSHIRNYYFGKGLTSSENNSFTVGWGSKQFVVTDSGAGFFGVTPSAQQSGGAATATGTYGATEQGMLQRAYDTLRAFGLLS